MEEAEKQKKNSRKNPCQFLIPKYRFRDFFGRRRPGTVSSLSGSARKGRMYRKLHDKMALEGRMYRKLHDKMALEGRMYRAGHVGGVGRAKKWARHCDERRVGLPG